MTAHMEKNVTNVQNVAGASKSCVRRRGREETAFRIMAGNKQCWPKADHDGSQVVCILFGNGTLQTKTAIPKYTFAMKPFHMAPGTITQNLL